MSSFFVYSLPALTSTPPAQPADHDRRKSGGPVVLWNARKMKQVLSWHF